MVCGKMLGAGDLDDGTIIGFVLVVTAGPSLGLGRVCVPAGLKTAAKGRKGPGEFFSGSRPLIFSQVEVFPVSGRSGYAGKVIGSRLGELA